MFKGRISQYLAEFIGTFFLVFLGAGSVILSQNPDGEFSSFVIPLVFGGTVSVMIYSVGHISGAHFNPAVTIAFWATRKFPLNKVPFYLSSQFLGAVCGSFVHKLLFSYSHNFGTTNPHLSLSGTLAVEVILSFLLMFVIISVATDTRAVGELAGLAIGTTVTLCAFIGGPLTGASMNPARSLGPALVSGNFDSLWIYFFAPIFGAILGGWVYEKIKCFVPGDSEHGCC